MTRKVLFVIHGARPDAFSVARAAAKGLLANNIAVACADADSGELEIPEVTSGISSSPESASAQATAMLLASKPLAAARATLKASGRAP